MAPVGWLWLVVSWLAADDVAGSWLASEVTDPDSDPTLSPAPDSASSVTFKMAIKKNFPKFLCLLLFEGTYTSFFKDRKS
jgi:hypothetical protein